MNKEKRSKVTYLTVDKDFSPQRIDNFLITHLKGVPKSHIYRILRRGEVKVNKKKVKPNYKIQGGEEIRLPPIEVQAKKPLTPHHPLGHLLSNRVLYEDAGLLIINKPPGIPVHGGSGVDVGLVEVLKTMYPKSPHLELAHRLDRDTSGCLILAKKRSILKELHELMRTGKIRKVYLALTKGHWRPEEYRVAVSLQKNQLSSGERIVKVAKTGKESITVFNPVQVFKNATLVEATLLTGRTHQIRVHAQYRAHPIAGDEKYGDREFNKSMRKIGLKRLFLHASLLEFVLPSTEQTIRVTAPLDPDLQFISYLTST